MTLKNRWLAKDSLGQKLLRWVNLRPEESERTMLMFAFYTTTSIGLLWLEASTVALFLKEYGADKLPWIYIASAGIGSGLGFLYSWMQRILPLRRVIVLTALLMAVPLLLFRFGLNAEDGATIGSIAVLSLTVLLMRLWLEAIYVLNDLNTSITANQLFNIREIKRTFPLISSGVLVADVISGFSLPFLLSFVKVADVILIACLVMALGAGVLFYLSQSYSQFFPEAPRRRLEEAHPDQLTARRLKGPLRRYVILLFAFFMMAQVLFLLVDFQFLSQLENQNLAGQGLVGGIASFLGLFNGVLGVFELATQWFASSRVIERIGVFSAAMFLPIAIIVLGSFSMTGLVPLFVGLVILKFLDELLHYTLFTSTGPVLFQPLPEGVRSGLQSLVRGVAEPIATGLTGLSILGIIWFYKNTDLAIQLRDWIFLSQIIILAAIWLFTVWLLRSRYVGLLVVGAERGQLSISDVDLRELKRAVIETLNRPGTEADKRSCIELLSQIDPQNVGDALAPLIANLPPALQRQSLEAMLVYPNEAYLSQIRALIEQPLSPEVLAVALRYIWLTEREPDIRQLRPYLRPEVDPVVRGTAASLMLRRGTPRQKAEATNTLRQMLTHKKERERVMGCRALGEAVYLQALRLYIPNLLQDESLRVRCALLEAIAATHLDEYYPSLLRGLHYKSTREAAMRALVRLEDEAIPLLVELAEDNHKPDLVRMQAWSAIGQIGTHKALDVLVAHLMTAWGATRRNVLRILLKIPHEQGIDAISDRLGRSGVETLIDQEILFIGQLYAALVDLNSEQILGGEADLLRRALEDVHTDAVERLFLLMKVLYPLEAIQAAALNLQSASPSSVAQGLEILDNTLDIANKRALLSVLDRRPEFDKLQSLSSMVAYEPMNASDRPRYLLDLRYFLPDWPLACCFHLARQARWSLTSEQILACLRYPTGYVREAVLTYLKVASPRALKELLPKLTHDPDRLVAAQVQQMMAELGLADIKPQPNGSKPPDRPASFSDVVGFETI